MFPQKLLSRNPHSLPSKLPVRSSAPGSMGAARRFVIALFLTPNCVSDWIYMTQNEKADKLQIKPFDKNMPLPASAAQQPDPRVTAFLERLREKAEAIDNEQREKHVPVKEPRRRPVADQSANPDWYQPVADKKTTQQATAVKRFVGVPKRKAKTG